MEGKLKNDGLPLGTKSLFISRNLNTGRVSITLIRLPKYLCSETSIRKSVISLLSVSGPMFSGYRNGGRFPSRGSYTFKEGFKSCEDGICKIELYENVHSNVIWFGGPDSEELMRSFNNKIIKEVYLRALQKAYKDAWIETEVFVDNDCIREKGGEKRVLAEVFLVDDGPPILNPTYHYEFNYISIPEEVDNGLKRELDFIKKLRT